jgi:DNA-binding MarR family transcriptional regulator
MKSGSEPPAAPEIHEQVLVELRRIVRALDLQSKQLQKAGLTGSQSLVLRALAKHGELPANRLSQAVSLSQGTITTILDRLELKGLIRRERSPADKRRLVVTLTDDGREALNRAPSLLHVNFLTAFKRLDNWEQTLILSCLQRVAGMMDLNPAQTARPQDLAEMERALRVLTGETEESGC